MKFSNFFINITLHDIHPNLQLIIRCWYTIILILLVVNCHDDILMIVNSQVFCSDRPWARALHLYVQQNFRLLSFSFCVCLCHVLACSFLAWGKPLSIPLSLSVHLVYSQIWQKLQPAISPLLSLSLFLSPPSVIRFLKPAATKKKTKEKISSHPRKFIRFVA